MSKKEVRYNLRLTSEELGRWHAFAVAADLSLSAWIRERCNMDGQWKNVKEFLRERPEDENALAMESAKKLAIEKLENQVDIGRKPCKHGMLFCKKCA